MLLSLDSHGMTPNGSAPLRRFLLLSLLLHGIVLAAWFQPRAEFQAGPSPMLAVVLAAARAPAPASPLSDPTAPTAPATAPERKQPAIHRSPAPAAATAEPVAPLPPRSDAATVAPAAQAPMTTAAASAAVVLAAVRTRIDAHFVYPLLARRHGWQGEVLLGFRVDTDGSLHAVHIARSSGHPLLDRSALESLQQVQRVELLPAATLDLQLPVIYRLEES